MNREEQIRAGFLFLANLIKVADQQRGDLNDLNTNNQTTLVGAVNEMLAQFDTVVSGLVDDTTPATDKTYSSQHVETYVTTQIASALVAALEGQDLSDIASSVQALMQADNGLISAVAPQMFTDAQKIIALNNLSAASQAEVSDINNQILSMVQEFNTLNGIALSNRDRIIVLENTSTDAVVAPYYQSIADLEAARPASTQQPRSLSRVTADPAFGFIEVICVDLGNGKQWLPYPKILDDSVRMGWGDFSGFTAGLFSGISSTIMTASLDLSPPTATAAALAEVRQLFPIANIRVSTAVISSGSSASANVDARITPLNSVPFIAITSASLGGVSRDTSVYNFTHDDLMTNISVRATNSPSSSSVIFVLNHLAR